MKFLLVNYEYPPIGAGAATATQQLAKELVSLGHEVIVLTAKFGNLPTQSTESGVVVYRCKTRRRHKDRSNILEMLLFSFVGLWVSTRLMRRHPADGVIAFFSFPCGPIALAIKLLRRVPYIVSLRGGDVPGTEKSLAWMHALLAPLRRLILRHSMAVVANSVGLKNLSMRADPYPVDVIPNGVDSTFFTPPERVVATPFTFLFVGRFQPQKNLVFLLKSLAAVKKETALPFRLVMVGDGFLKPELAHLAGELGLNNVEWHGWTDRVQLKFIYQNAHCFLNPSLYEGMPNTVLEAMGSGLATLASDVPGNDAVVSHGVSGYLFPLERPELFRQYMLQLINEPELALRLGRKAREIAAMNFSWKRAAETYAAYFEKRNALYAV